MKGDYLKRRFKDEAVSLYSIENDTDSSVLKRYVVSTSNTRNMLNFPEIVNSDFTNLMKNGITNTLKGLNNIEHLSSVSSKQVNVYHILRGGLNFEMRNALHKAFGYKWHSSSYISSQRHEKDGEFAIADDSYRKFQIPDNATVYSADIVASGASLDNSLHFLDNYLTTENLRIKNFIFVTIGCSKAEDVLEKWDLNFKKNHPEYEKTILIYIEGRFALGNKKLPLYNVLPNTDLLKNYKFGALLTPEYEFSQFEKMIIPLEACAIYDGGKKSFEPVQHIMDILEFWEKQEKSAEAQDLSLWDEYNARFSLDMYVVPESNSEADSYLWLKK
ncbi:MAG: hypothetical protein KAR21_26240, partial [Spirochaetales bacterium]|nr:hypothetical protein [Spirochaetales bacterium]